MDSNQLKKMIKLLHIFLAFLKNNLQKFNVYIYRIVSIDVD
jgi:hypothetical protein